MSVLNVDVEKDIVHFSCFPSDKDKANKIGGVWNQSSKTWDFPFDLNSIEKILQEFPQVLLPNNFNDMLEQKKKLLEEINIIKDEAKADKEVTYKVSGVKMALYNYQKHGVRLGSIVPNGFLIADEMGLGKMESVDNKLFTPYGRKRIGDIKVGDYVIGSNGKKTKVIGVFPHGLRDLYRITFNDGYSVLTGLKHLWSVASTNNGKNTNGRKTYYEVLSVGQMLDKSLYLEKKGIGHNLNKKYKFRTYYKKPNGDNRWQIPVVEPIEFENNHDLKIEPYLLGVILGDGHILAKTAIITTHKDDFDEMYRNYKNNRGFNFSEGKGNVRRPNIRIANFKFNNEFADLCLKRKRAWNKFIPDVYKYSTISNRLAILQGLMDTDGHCIISKNNADFVGTEYCSVSEKLVDDVAEIVHSLGGIARKHSKIGSYKDKNGNKKICRKAFRLNIKMPEGFNPFRLKRKREEYHIPLKYSVTRYISDIRFEKQGEAVCIAVDAPDNLYITEHAIVTHNTVQAIGIAMIMKKRKNIKNCLIICPASVKHNWMNEIKKFTDEKCLVIEGDITERFEKWFSQDVFFKIVNYEIFTRDLVFFDKKTLDENGKEISKKDVRIPDADKILNGFFDVNILDEIHYMKTHRSLRTRAIKKMKCEKRIGLTGTPLDGRLEELHSIFGFLVPGLFPNKQKFLEKHAKYNYFGGVEGYVKIDEVREKIEPYYLRRLKKDVLKDLPPKIFKDVYVTLSKKAQGIYDDIASRKSEITLEKEAIVAVVRCRQFCDMPEILDLDMESDKLKKLKELLFEIIDENKQKVIIFSQYERATRILFRELSKIYKVVYFYGGTPPKERIDICNDFNADQSKQIIIMTDAGSVGINLQSATYVIHYDTNYSPAVMAQRSDRAHRIGQKGTVTVIRLICEDTVEQRVLEIIDGKLKINDSVLDENMLEMSLGKLSTRDLLSCL